jgi:hypothetical protein
MLLSITRAKLNEPDAGSSMQGGAGAERQRFGEYVSWSGASFGARNALPLSANAYRVIPAGNLFDLTCRTAAVVDEHLNARS